MSVGMRSHHASRSATSPKSNGRRVQRFAGAGCGKTWFGYCITAPTCGSLFCPCDRIVSGTQSLAAVAHPLPRAAKARDILLISLLPPNRSASESSTPSLGNVIIRQRRTARLSFRSKSFEAGDDFPRLHRFAALHCRAGVAGHTARSHRRSASRRLAREPQCATVRCSGANGSVMFKLEASLERTCAKGYRQLRHTLRRPAGAVPATQPYSQ